MFDRHDWFVVGLFGGMIAACLLVQVLFPI
jgi:hypothetical protein